MPRRFGHGTGARWCAAAARNYLLTALQIHQATTTKITHGTSALKIRSTSRTTAAETAARLVSAFASSVMKRQRGSNGMSVSRNYAKDSGVVTSVWSVVTRRSSGIDSGINPQILLTGLQSIRKILQKRPQMRHLIRATNRMEGKDSQAVGPAFPRTNDSEPKQPPLKE